MPSFQTITPGIRTVTNHAEFDTSRAVQGVNARRNKILVLGRRLPSGSADKLVPKQVLSGDQAEAYHGTGSELAEMVRAAKKANSQTEMWSCSIDPLSSGTAGTKTITITGPATADGTIQLRIAGRFYVPVAVSAGDVANAIATALNAAIQAHPEYLRMPFTSSAASGVVTLTMRWKGVETADARVNYYPSEQSPAGVTVVIAAGVAGAGNPDVTQILDAIGDVVQYDSIVMPFTDPANLAALETELKSRWGGMRQNDGVAFAAVTGSHAMATTLGTSRNSAFLCLMAANTSPTPSWIWAAVVAAVEAAEPDPARPRQGLTLPGVLPATPTELWGQADRNLLLYSGCATHVVDSGGNVAIERLITTYQSNSLGVPDTALLDIETVRTASFIRYDGNVSVSLSFPRHKLAKDGVPLPVGQPIVTPRTMRGFFDGKYDQWTALGLVEGAAKEQFTTELVVQIDSTDPNRLVAQAGPDFVNQFRGLSMQWQFIV